MKLLIVTQRNSKHVSNAIFRLANSVRINLFFLAILLECTTKDPTSNQENTKYFPLAFLFRPGAL